MTSTTFEPSVDQKPFLSVFGRPFYCFWSVCEIKAACEIKTALSRKDYKRIPLFNAPPRIETALHKNL